MDLNFSTCLSLFRSLEANPGFGGSMSSFSHHSDGSLQLLDVFNSHTSPKGLEIQRVVAVIA